MPTSGSGVDDTEDDHDPGKRRKNKKMGLGSSSEHDQLSELVRSNKDVSGKRLVRLESKRPTFEKGNFRLNFHGRS